MQAKLVSLRAKTASGEAPSLADLRNLQVYGWVLTTEEKIEVEKMMANVVALDLQGAADAAMRPDMPAPKSKASRKKVQKNARDTLMSLLSS